MSFDFFKPSSSTKSSAGKVIAITGASGLVGSSLTSLLENKYNAKVIKITTKKKASDDNTISWDPASETIDEDAVSKLNGIDAIVHLAGENVASGSGPFAILGTWDDAKKAKIINSRVSGTQLIVDTIGKLKTKPKVFISASAVGFYGYTDANSIFDESEKSRGDGFLAEVVEAWETEALKADKKGVKQVVCLRFAPIFSSSAGILAKLLPLFNLGGGGVIGSGQQGFSWVTLNDAIRSIEFILFDKKGGSLKGPVNICSPNPVTNEKFTFSMGTALSRPTVFPLPEFVCSTVFGEMGTEMLLGGQKTVPKKLLAAGFGFDDADITDAISKNK